MCRKFQWKRHAWRTAKSSTYPTIASSRTIKFAWRQETFLSYCQDPPLKVLLIRHYHEVTLHGGGNLTLNTMREQFWLVNGKMVNNFIKNFVKCFCFQSKSTPQLMADLPSERVTPARAFSSCGIDFAGPFNVKHKKNPIIYIAVFICLVTKAIHVDLVSSLTRKTA